MGAGNRARDLARRLKRVRTNVEHDVHDSFRVYPVAVIGPLKLVSLHETVFGFYSPGFQDVFI